MAPLMLSTLRARLAMHSGIPYCIVFNTFLTVALVCPFCMTLHGRTLNKNNFVHYVLYVTETSAGVRWKYWRNTFFENFLPGTFFHELHLFWILKIIGNTNLWVRRPASVNSFEACGLFISLSGVEALFSLITRRVFVGTCSPEGSEEICTLKSELHSSWAAWSAGVKVLVSKCRVVKSVAIVGLRFSCSSCVGVEGFLPRWSRALPD